ncbi:hypothetical protein R1flu_000681 [Riccia fluitans]|uniref:Uncharacterized protein n=1 Tax=Riccia fluitans TaxID=41844 RepID=A0ABD1Y1H2_9MARC
MFLDVTRFGDPSTVNVTGSKPDDLVVNGHVQVRKLPNMVIKDEIGEQVKSSLVAAVAALDHAARGSYLHTAVKVCLFVL